jgi:hypothetical protein
LTICGPELIEMQGHGGLETGTHLDFAMPLIAPLKIRLITAAALLIFATNGTIAQGGRRLPMNETPPRRFVRGQVLVSTRLPNIRVRLSKAFHFVGKFSFTVPNMAKGERYIFAETHGRKVKRLFIAQFETILPDSSETYNYSFKDALTLGGHKFRPNTFTFSRRASVKTDPPDEGVLTTEFLTRKGYILEDEVMVSRVVNVPDVERKHEMILFYMENINDSGHRLRDFYNGEERTPLWQEMSRALTKRSFESFAIIK